MKNNTLSPAFPITEETTDRIDLGIKIYAGLTKREYFAAMAMQGIIANAPNGHLSNSTEGSRMVIQWADAVLAELEKSHA